MKIQDFKLLAQGETGNFVNTIREMKTILSSEIPELDRQTLNGLVGAVAAYTITELEEVAQMELTLEEYANISPTIPDVEHLMVNRSLGAYSRNLFILAYRLGQNNAVPVQPTP